MGAFKDISDLMAQLAKSVKDREVAGKLFEIQSLVAQLQGENTDLQSELLDLKKENQELRKRLSNKEQPTTFYKNLLWLPNDTDPCCPRCFELDERVVHMHLFEYDDMDNACLSGCPITAAHSYFWRERSTLPP